MNERYLVTDYFGNSLTNWCGWERACREYVMRRNRGEEVKMWRKSKGQPMTYLPEV